MTKTDILRYYGSDGKVVGDPIQIDEKTYYVLTTDENGLITANLKQGLYKAIEISTGDRYVLDTSQHTFGIDDSKAATRGWANGILGNGWNYINSADASSNGGTIAVGSISSYSGDLAESITGIEAEGTVIDGAYVDRDQKVLEVSKGDYDGLIVSYGSTGEYLWSKTFGGTDEDSFNKIIQITNSKDETTGYIAVGYTSSSTVEYDGTKIPELSTNSSLGNKDGVLLKLDANGDYLWGVRIGGTLDDEIMSVEYTSSGDIAIVGNYFSSSCDFYNYNSTDKETSLTNSTVYRDAFIALYDNSGAYKWATQIEQATSSNDSALDVIEYSEGLAVAANSGTYPYLRLYNLDTGTMIVATKLTDSGYGKITSLDIDVDGTIIAGVNNATSSTAVYAAKIYKITVSGTTVTSDEFYSLSGTYNEYVSDVVVMSDGGILFGGWYYSTDTTGTDGLTLAERSSNYSPDGYVIKLNAEGTAVYANRLYGTYSSDNTTDANAYDVVTCVAETSEGDAIAGGSFSSATLIASNFELGEGSGQSVTADNQLVMLEQIGNFEGFVIGTSIVSPEVAEAKTVEVENKIKTFKITTQVDGTGGTITGEYVTAPDGTEYLEADGIKYIETVEYDRSSTKEIVITPDENCKVESITINGEEYTNFIPDSSGTVTFSIGNFENIKEDIHIVVKFSSTIGNVVVQHYLWNGATTTTQVAGDEYYSGNIEIKDSDGNVTQEAENYTAQPASDIDYVLITNGDLYTEEELTALGLIATDPYIPDNSTGQYELETQTVTYYYKEKTYTLTVHHYIAGTSTEVPSKGGGTVGDVVTEGLRKDYEYTTHPAFKDNLTDEDTKDLTEEQINNLIVDENIYELVDEPQNGTGTITEDTEVIYYYKIIDVGIKITKVDQSDTSVTLEGAEFKLYKYIGSSGNDDLIDTTNVDTSEWSLVGNYTSSGTGIVSLEDLPITEEYRLVETKAPDGMMLPDGQWKIEFLYGEYDKTDLTIVTVQEVATRITAVGNPPALKVAEEDKLLLLNEEYYDLPTSGNTGIEIFNKIGTILIICGLVALVIAKRKNLLKIAKISKTNKPKVKGKHKK